GYRVATKSATDQYSRTYVLQFARPLSDLEATIDRVRFFLIMGVLGGAGLALIAGLLIAQGAMAPIARLTATARRIGETRDPALRVEVPDTNDEGAELARTLAEMLVALDGA